MLCAHCATPIPTASSTCLRCGQLSPGRSYYSALVAADTRADMQPEIPTVRATGLGSGVHAIQAGVETTRPVSATTQPVTTIKFALASSTPIQRAAGAPYTIRHLLDDTFGAPTRAQRIYPRTMLRRLLAERLEARLATNKWISATLGAALAVGLGLILTLLAQGLLNGALGSAPQSNDASATAAFTGDALRALLGGNPIKLFLIAQRVPLQLVSGPGAVNGQLSLFAPLTLLALIPLIALVLGGAVASASDFERRARYSVARGALLGPVYALFLLALALCSLSPVEGDALGAAGGAYVMAAPVGAFMSGLVWGTLYGALGGWIHLHGRRSLRALPRSLERLPVPRLVGAALGGLTAVGAGLLACLGVALAVAVYFTLNGMTPTLSGGLTRLHAAPGESLTTLALMATLAPSLAATLWSLSVGAPIQTAQVSYVGQGAFQSGFGAFGLSTWGGAWLLLALIPVVACFFGGRIAARFIGARRIVGAITTGALIAPVVSAITYLLVAQAGVGVAASLPGGSFILDVSPDAFTAALRIFALAALAGGLGGWSTLFTPAPLSDRLAIPGLLAVRARLYATLDALTRRPSCAPPSSTRALCYDAALAACGLSALTLALDGATLLLARSISLTYLSAATSLAAALLVAIPFLWLAVALLSATTNLLAALTRSA